MTGSPIFLLESPANRALPDRSVTARVSTGPVRGALARGCPGLSPGQVNGELTLQRLGDPVAEAVRDGSGCRVGEDVFLALLQPIEDARCRRLGRGLGDLEASGHVGVDRPEED